MNSKLKEKVQSTFITEFGEKPTLIASPGRINLIGEHTDYNDGYVLPAAIDKGFITAIAKTNESVCTVIALDLEETYVFSLEDVVPLKNGDWRNYILGVIAELQKKGKIIQNFNLVFSGDIPAGSGLSSSAALENSVVFGLNYLFELALSKKEMIFISQKAEHNFVGVKCGIMDQYASMYGETDKALFLNCRTLETESFKIDFLGYTIVLFNSNVKHTLAESAYNERREVCEKTANLLDIKALIDADLPLLDSIKNQLSNDEYLKAKYVIEENNRVLAAISAIKNDDITILGQLLFESHNGLKNDYNVSCKELDFLVDLGIKNDAVIGARMMGGGFGGCTINLVKKDNVNQFITETSKAYLNQFNKDCSVYHVKLTQGTHLIEN